MRWMTRTGLEEAKAYTGPEPFMHHAGHEVSALYIRDYAALCLRLMDERDAARDSVRELLKDSWHDWATAEYLANLYNCGPIPALVKARACLPELEEDPK